jgi:hypothetical protein
VNADADAADADVDTKRARTINPFIHFVALLLCLLSNPTKQTCTYTHYTTTYADTTNLHMSCISKVEPMSIRTLFRSSCLVSCSGSERGEYCTCHHAFLSHVRLFVCCNLGTSKWNMELEYTCYFPLRLLVSSSLKKDLKARECVERGKEMLEC